MEAMRFAVMMISFSSLAKLIHLVSVRRTNSAIRDMQNGYIALITAATVDHPHDVS